MNAVVTHSNIRASKVHPDRTSLFTFQLPVLFD